MFPNQTDRNYFKSFLDQAKINAERAGRTNVLWLDIWLAALNDSELARILSQKNINTNVMKTEIRYLSRFTDVLTGQMPITKDSVFQQALRELEESFSQIEAFNRIDSTSLHAAVQIVLEHTFDALRRNAITQDAKNAELAEVKMKILGDAFEDAIEPFLQQIGLNILEPDKLVSLSKTLYPHVADAFLYGENEVDQANAISILESLEDNPISDPSPVEVIDTMIKESGVILQRLQHRAGLRYGVGQKPEIMDFEQELPPRIIQSVFNTALTIAYSNNADSLTPTHIAQALIDTSEAQIHLRKVGIKDLQVFRDKLAKQIAIAEGRATLDNSIKKAFDELLQEDEGEDTEVVVFAHPDIPDLSDLRTSMTAAYKQMPHAAALLFAVLEQDKAVDKLLNLAGLTRAMRKIWDTQYDKDLKKEKKKQKKTGPKEFEVSESELDKLLKEYGADLTAQARAKKFSPLIGNDGIISTLLTKLLKKGKKNPVVVAPSGVGKTKILEGLAQAVSAGRVPKPLIGARVLSLDLHKMNNTPWIGVFEGRLLPILKGVAERNASGKTAPIILVIDEFGTALKAGGHQHSEGFEGLVKPYLTNGDLLVVAATTEDSYRKKIDTNPELMRRMEPVYLKEPTQEETVKILEGLKSGYTSHHKTRITKDMLLHVAHMASRYIKGIKNPDKSIDLLDEASALVQKEGGSRLTIAHINQAVSNKTNIPLSYLSENDNARYATIDRTLKRHVLDQDEAVDQVAAIIKRAKAGLNDPNRPLGNFLFVGPTGVGKTELAKALHQAIFDPNEQPIRFDMGEFQDKTSVGRFTGANPGYVGYEEGGKLITAVRGKPFSVILYDEIEKAHSDVCDALLTAFGEGSIKDGRGIEADLKNAINIMTSNLGAAEVRATAAQRRIDPIENSEAWNEMATPIYLAAVKAHFRPEFLNRLDGVIVFNGLKPKTIEKLVQRELRGTADRLEKAQGLALDVSAEFLKAAAVRGYSPEYGARPLTREWNKLVVNPMSAFLLDQGPRIKGKSKTLAVLPDDDFTDAPEPQLEQNTNVVLRLVGTQRARSTARDLATLRPRFVLR